MVPPRASTSSPRAALRALARDVRAGGARAPGSRRAGRRRSRASSRPAAPRSPPRARARPSSPARPGPARRGWSGHWPARIWPDDLEHDGAWATSDARTRVAVHGRAVERRQVRVRAARLRRARGRGPPSSGTSSAASARRALEDDVEGRVDGDHAPSVAIVPRDPSAAGATPGGSALGWTFGRSRVVRTVAWEDGVRRVDRPAAACRRRSRTSAAASLARSRRPFATWRCAARPPIGVTAAFGIALGIAARRPRARPCARDFEAVCGSCAARRPTAVNLFWAIERMRRRFAQERAARRRRPCAQALLAEAQAHPRRGPRGLPPHGRPRRRAHHRSRARILTHCNAGALATAGYGTALGVIRSGRARRARAAASSPTRPVPISRARASPPGSWCQDGIPTTLDRRQHGRPPDGDGARWTLVVVGADRIAANGDVANKIGTYTVAVLAKENGIPFYVRGARLDLRPRAPPSGGDPDRGAPRGRGDAPRRPPHGSRGRTRCATPPSTSRRTATSPPSSAERGVASPAVRRVSLREAGGVVRRRAVVLASRSQRFRHARRERPRAADWSRFPAARTARASPTARRRPRVARSGRRGLEGGRAARVLLADPVRRPALPHGPSRRRPAGALPGAAPTAARLWRHKAPRPRVEKVDRRQHARPVAERGRRIQDRRRRVFFADFGETRRLRPRGPGALAHAAARGPSTTF